MIRTFGCGGTTSLPRRAVLQAGSLGLLGLSSADVADWRAHAAEGASSGEASGRNLHLFDRWSFAA